jgi:hypothetical protein
MSNDDFERVRGSGNVFRDMGFPEADILQAGQEPACREDHRRAR